MMTKLMWLFAAGGLGALARYGLGGFVQRLCGSGFPFGTIVVNLVGCLAFGFVWTLADERLIISGETRFIIHGALRCSRSDCDVPKSAAYQSKIGESRSSRRSTSTEHFVGSAKKASVFCCSCSSSRSVV